LCRCAAILLVSAAAVLGFPGLLAAGLEESGRMAPDREIVELAARVPKSTLKRWTSEGDLHSVPVRVYVNERAHGLILESEQEGDGADEDWAIDAWKHLLRHLMSGAKYPQEPGLADRVERARYFLRQRSSGAPSGMRCKNGRRTYQKAKRSYAFPAL
jgi:hypothetical protein